MNLTRTTVRIEPALKKIAQRQAIELDISFQDLFNQALRAYINTKIKQKAKKIVFTTQQLEAPLDNLTREDIYAD